MKLSIVTSVFPYPRETFASIHIKNWANLGAEIKVHSLRSERPDKQELIERRKLDGIEFDYLSAGTLKVAILSIMKRPHVFFYLCFLWLRYFSFQSIWLKSVLHFPRFLAIYEQIKVDRPSVLHLYWGHFPAFVGMLVSKFQPEVQVTMGWIAYDFRMNLSLSKAMAKAASKVVVISQFTKEVAGCRGVPLSKVLVMRDGIDLHDGITQINSEKVPLSICSAGYFADFKKFDQVVSVFAKVQEKYPNARLTLIGDGDERPRLEAEIKKRGLLNCQITGFLNHNEVLKEMQRNEVFLYLSEKDFLPNVIKEAMFSGCFCIARTTHGIDELMNQSWGRILRSDGLEEAAFEEIDAFFDRPASYQAGLSEARDFIIDYYEINQYSKLIYGCWSDELQNT